MKDVYLQARKTQKVLEGALREFRRGRTVFIKKDLQRKGLLEGGLIHHIDVLSSHQAFRFYRTLMDLLKYRVGPVDRKFLEGESLLAVRYYQKYRESHPKLIEEASKFLIGLPVSFEDRDLLARLLDSPYWLVNVLLRESSPLRVPMIGARILKVLQVQTFSPAMGILQRSVRESINV